MKKPEGVTCRDCRRWYWYAGSCSAHTYNEELGIDPMSPESIKDCDYFEIKLFSEPGSEHYDPLPSFDTCEIVKMARITEYVELTRRILENLI